MLRDDFYNIVKSDVSSGNIHAILSIDKNHRILKGHFPGQPVVPGVCMMQMIKELTELHLKKDLKITNADNMKFLAVLNPVETDQIEANIAYSETIKSVIVSATLFSGNITFFKLKATLETLA